MAVLEGLAAVAAIVPLMVAATSISGIVHVGPDPVQVNTSPLVPEVAFLKTPSFPTTTMVYPQL